MSIEHQHENSVEEWRILEAIATRHIDLSFKTRGWMFTLLTAIAVAFYGGIRDFGKMEFLILSSGIVIIFLGMELIHGLVLTDALSRVEILERMIRGELQYDGPRVSDSLRMSWSFRDYWIAFRNQAVYIPYLITIFLIAIIAAFAP